MSSDREEKSKYKRRDKELETTVVHLNQQTYILLSLDKDESVFIWAA